MTDQKNASPHGTPGATMKALSGNLLSAVVEALQDGELRNWEDAIFALGLTANAVTTLAITQGGNVTAEQYQERAKDVLGAAMSVTVVPIPQDKH